MGEWASIPLSRHVVFPTSSRRYVVLSSPSGRCWLSTSFFLRTSKSVFKACAVPTSYQRLLGTATLLNWFIYILILLIATNPSQLYFALKNNLVSHLDWGVGVGICICIYSHTHSHVVSRLSNQTSRPLLVNLCPTLTLSQIKLINSLCTSYDVNVCELS